MAKREIVFDTTEIVAVVPVKGEFMKAAPQIMHITYDQFTKITFEPCTEKKLFKSVPSEQIVLRIKKRMDPIVYTKMKHKEYFEEYKESFRTFAQKNRIDLVDET